MKVLKFGGTSVGSVDSILSVKKIVEAIEEPVIVVVSALGGITDKLLKTASMATNGDVAYEREFSEIVARHRDVIQGVIPDKTKRIEVQKQVMALLDELGNIYKGVYLINDLSAKTSDTIVSYGERLSSGIVAAVLEGSRLYDAREFIRTKTDFGKHIAEPDLTEKLIRERLADRPRVSVVPGFIASDCATGDVTNLGRGGSDYTAALIAAALNAETGDVLLLVSDTDWVKACTALGQVRLDIARKHGLIDPDKFNFLWVVDFPLFEYSEQEGRWMAMHHPFTLPKAEDLDKVESDPGACHAVAYDIVLNGVEMGGGSMRINDPALQDRMFHALGFTEEKARESFGFLMDAYKFGAPPHGGMAYGLDRMVMLMLKKDSIRDVIAFPKVQNAGEPMSGAPDVVDEQQLKDLSIALTLKD